MLRVAMLWNIIAIIIGYPSVRHAKKRGYSGTSCVVGIGAPPLTSCVESKVMLGGAPTHQLQRATPIPWYTHGGGSNAKPTTHNAKPLTLSTIKIRIFAAQNKFNYRYGSQYQRALC